jgi:hypothetical protein
MKLMMTMFALGTAVLTNSVLAAECAPSNFPKSSSYIKVRITNQEGKSEEVTLSPRLQKTGQQEFGESQTLFVHGKSVQTIKLAMAYRETNLWEKMDGKVALDKYKPYYIPAIGVHVVNGSINSDGFVPDSVGGTTTSIPSRVNSGVDVEGLKIDIVEIIDRDGLSANCGKRFEATLAEAACYDRKYTNDCIARYSAVHPDAGHPDQSAGSQK